jgi:undecaprenyl-diphosphatase
VSNRRLWLVASVQLKIMNILQAIVLGIIEGITEFLPISSTGHLILASDLMKIADSEFVKTFEIFIQLGAICAVVLLYWKRVANNLDLAKKILVAFLPTAVIGIVAYSYVKQHLLGNEAVVLWALFLGGVAIYYFEKNFKHKEPAVHLGQMTYKQAAWVGLAQAVAIIPGVSRAAATILGGLFIGLDRRSIVEFSFLLAIPTMAAATGWDLVRSASSFNSSDFGILAVGFVVSFITAWFAVKWLLRYIQSHDFASFGVYRVILAVLFWLWVM